MKPCVPKFHNNPPLEGIPAKDDVLRISSLSSFESAEPWGVSQRTRLFKIANRWPREIGSVEKGIKRPKCVAQKPLKKVNRTQGSSGVNRCDLVYGASSCPFFLFLSLPLSFFLFVLLYFRRWFTIGTTIAFVLSSNFFYFLPGNAYGARRAMRRGTSSAISRNFRSWWPFSRFFLRVKKNSTSYWM